MRTRRPSTHRPLSTSLSRFHSMMAICAALLAGRAADAQNYNWDPGLTNGPAGGGGGTWDLSLGNWFDGVGDVQWPNTTSATAIFGGVGNVVTINTGATGVTANGLIFNGPGYVLTGATASEMLTLGGTAPTVTVTNASDTATITATIADIAASGFSKAGNGTLVLSGANTYTGTTTVTAGTLSVTNAAGLGTTAGGTTVSSGATLDLNNVSLGAEAITINGAGVGGNGALTATGSATTAGPVTMAGASTIGGTGNLTIGGIFDNGGSAALTKVGTGTLSLAVASTRTGTTAINGGTISAGSATALGTGDVTVGGSGTLTSTVAGAHTWGTNVILNGGTLSQNNGAATMSFAGGKSLTIGASGGTVNVGPSGLAASKILLAANQLAGAGLLTKNGAGVIQLSGANTGFTGTVQLDGGTIEFQNADALGTAATTVVVNSGGDFVTSGVANRNNIKLNAGGTISANNNASNFTGTIQVLGSANIGLRAFQATGNANSFTIGGTLTGSGDLNVTAPSAATLKLTGSNTGYNGTITANTNVRLLGVTGAGNDAFGAASINLAGSTLAIAPTITAPGANSGFQGSYYNAGAALVGNGVVGGYDFGIVNPIGVRNDATINIPNNAGGFSPTPPVGGLTGTNLAALWTGVLNVGSAGSYTFFTQSDDGSLLYVDGQQVVQNDFSQGFTERNGVVNLSAGLHSVIVKYGQGTGGAGMVVNYQGPDSANTKVLLGSVASSLTNTGSSIFGSASIDNNINVTANSSIDVAGANATSTGTITFGSGTGLTVTGVTGAETLTQSGNVTLNGTNTITTGVTQVLNGAANASAGADLTISGNIGEGTAGSSLAKVGPRTLTLTGTNTFTGGITVLGGTLVGNVASLGSNNITNNAALVFDQAGNGLFAGNLTGTGTVTKQNNGTLTLIGTNTVNGAFTINGGGIVLGADLNGTGTVTVNSGATLSGPGVSVANPVVINSGGAIAGTTGSTFNTTNLTLNAGRTNVTLGAPTTTAAISSSGAFASSFAIVNLTNGGTAAAGTYRLLDYAGSALTATQFANVVLGTNPSGFYGALVNNTTDTAIDLVLQAAAPTVTWTGATNGVWDTSTANWSSGTYVEGRQVVFPSAGPTNRNITGPTVSPQSVTADTTGGNYSIANNLAGGVIGGINKNGTGTLTLTGDNTINGKTTVTAGTLAVGIDNEAGTRSAGVGQVELGGGTYSVTPVAAKGQTGLLGSYFTGAAGVTSARDYTATPLVTRVESIINTAYTAAANPGPGIGTVNGANLENWGGLFSGKYFVDTAGPQTFSISSDDSTRLFIDGVPIIINEGGQGGTYTFTNTVTLSAGYHDIKLEYNQGTGGGVVRLYTPNGIGNNGLSFADTINLGSLLNVTSSSTLDLSGGDFATASFGALTQTTGSTLNITGLAGKQLSFGSTIANGTGTLTINSTPDVTLGVTTAPGATIVKQGNGRLVLDNTNASTPNNLTGSTIEVQGGKLVAVGGGGTNNPLGTASIVLNGGGLFLDAKSAASTFANNVTLQQGATIEVLPSALSMTLGSTATTLALGSNNLTIDTYGGGTDSVVAGNRQSIGNSVGNTLVISSPITGSGNITKTSTELNSVNAIALSRQPGQLTLTAESPNYSGTTTINRGTLQANGAASATSKVLGTGGVVINVTDLYSGDTINTPAVNSGNTTLVQSITRNPSLVLKSNSNGTATTTVFGNALTLQGPGTQVTIDVNNNGANSNNNIQLGALTITGGLNQLNVTGGNTYYLGFDPASTTALPNQATTYLGTSGFIVNPTTGNLRFGGNVTEAGTLLKIGAGTLRLDGTNTLGGLSVRGGTLAFTNQAAVPTTFSMMNGSAVQLAGTGGSFADNANPGNNLIGVTANSIISSVRFDNSLGLTTNAGGRWGDNAPLVLNAIQTTQTDSLVLVPSSAADVTETIGALSFRGGARVRVVPNYAGRIATLQVASLTRLDKGTMDIATGAASNLLGAAGTQAGTLGSAAANGSRIIVTGTAPARGSNGTTTINMITPTIWDASAQNFVDYTGPNGLAGITYGSTNLNAPGSITTVNAAATALTTSPTVYALKITGALTSAAAQIVTIQGDQTAGNDGTASLIAAGAITANDANTTLFFGTSGASPVPREAIIHAQGGNVTFNGKIVANGLTKDGDSVMLMTTDQTRSGSGATLTGLEGDIVVNRGGLSLRAQNAVGKGGSGAAGSGTTRIILAGGTLETRLDTATTFGAGSGGSAYDIVIRENSVINPDRVSTNNIAHTFGNLSFEPTADGLRVLSNSQHRIIFGGTAPINLPNVTTFDVTDNGTNAVLGGLFNNTAALTTRGQITGSGIIKIGAGKWQASAAGQSMTFTGGTRVENGSLAFEYNPATAAAGTIQFGTDAITISNGGSFGVLGNAAAGAATTNVDFSNTINVVDFGGGFHLAHATANQQLRFTGQINLAAPLTIGSAGAGNLGNDPQYGVTGSTVLNLDQSAVGTRMLVIGGNDDVQLNGNIVDSAGSAANPLILQNQVGQVLFINGTGNSYANGTRILATPGTGTVGRIDVGATSQLGTGNVSVEGGFLAISALNNIAAGKKVTLTNASGAAGVLAFKNLSPTQADIASLVSTSSSNGVIALSNATAQTNALDLGAIGDGTNFLGAAITNTTYNATTLGVGTGNVYRLGGGNATLTIGNPNNNILTGANSLEVGNGLVNGGVNAANLTINGSNNYTGGTTVNFGGSTLTVAANGLGTGGLTVYTGTVTINGPQSISSNAIIGGAVNANAVNALGGGTINVGAGNGTSIGPTLNFGAEQNVALNLLGNSIIRANVGTVVTDALSFALPNSTLNVNGQNVLGLQGGAVTGAGASTSTVSVNASANGRFVNTALAIQNWNQLPATNLALNGSVLILDGSGLGGRTIGGTGANQIQLATTQVNGTGTNTAGNFNGTYFVGAGFAARTIPLTIGNSDVVSTSTFDRDFTIGSGATMAGRFYADAPLTLDADTAITARRTVTVGRTGPGLTKLNDAPNVVINNISADISGAGALVFHSASSSNGVSDPIAEVVLSGALTYTGSPTDDMDGGGTQNFVSAGPGGMIITTGPSNPAENGDIFVRFNGQGSLPNRASGTGDAYILVNRYAGTGVTSFRTGVLLTGDADGENYTLNANYKMLLGGTNGTGAPIGVTLGSTGGSATFRNSQVVLMGGDTGSTAVSTQAVLVRDGTFTLGDATGAINFQPANFTLTNNSSATTDPGIASAASTLENTTAARTLQVRGGGSVILGNVGYKKIDNTTDASSQFTWQLGGNIAATGTASAGVAEGFLRETSDSDASKNLSTVKLTMAGGVLELPSTHRAINLGTGVGQINMAGGIGGGFAAVGGPSSVNIGGAGATMTWASTAQFLGNNQTLILGSPAATDTLTLSNPIALNNASRSVAVIRGTGSTPEGELSGAVSGNGGLTFANVSRPNASFHTPGTVLLSGANTYTGATTINAGTVKVGNVLAIPSGPGAGNVVINNNGTLDLNGNNISVNGLSTTLGNSGRVSNSGLASTFTVGNNNTSSQFDGRITDAVSLAKTGSGTITLTGASTYTGTTKIDNGTLKLGTPATAAVAANWNADTIVGTNGTAVSTWTESVASKNATTTGTTFSAPTLALNSIGAHQAVRFSGVNQALQVLSGDSVISGQTNFTIALVFKTDTAGAGTAAQWYNNSGLIDAEQSGTAADWGIAWNSAGQVAGGIGDTDATTYSAGALDNDQAHVVVYSKSGNQLTLNVDGISSTTTLTGNAATAARGAFRFLMGSLNGLGTQFFNGDIASVQMFQGSLANNQVNSIGYNLANTYGVTGFAAPASSNILPTTTALSLSNSGATLDVNDVAQTVASVTGVSGTTINLGTIGSGALTAGDANDTTFAGALTGVGSFFKEGDSTLTLSGTGVATVSTVVNDGTVFVTGALDGAVTVNNGGRLKGTGTVGALTANNGGTVAPGDLTGILNAGNTSLGLGSILSLDLSNSNGGGQPLPGDYDRLNVTGTVSLANNISLTLGTGIHFDPSKVTSDVFYVILNDGADAVVGTFAGIGQGGTFIAPGGQQFLVSYTADFATGGVAGFQGAGNDVALLAVPEPTSGMAMLAACASLAGLQRFRRRKA